MAIIRFWAYSQFLKFVQVSCETDFIVTQMFVTDGTMIDLVVLDNKGKKHDLTT